MHHLSFPVLYSILLFSLLTTAFNANSDSNVVVYWGQGLDQPPLSQFCADPSIDIINLAFVNVLPDQGAGGLPGENFGRGCLGTISTSNGTRTGLLNDCPTIGSDIITCQSNGKKVLVSIGGALPGNGYLASDASAISFGNFLFGAFGPIMTAWTASNQPRPFGDAVVDGFDFDIESTGVTTAQESFGWATMINHLKNELFPLDTTKEYYISGAPQCILPDAHLSDAIANSWFDFILVQFYNTPYCSARSGINTLDGISQSSDYGISLDAWFAAPSFNPNSKIYIGLPASPSAAGSPEFYLTPSEVAQLVDAYRPSQDQRFGGVMLWDATWSYDNQIGGEPYADAIKQLLEAGSSNDPNQVLNPNNPGSTTTTYSTPPTPLASSFTTSWSAAPTGFVTSILPFPSTSATLVVTSTSVSSTSSATSTSGPSTCQAPLMPCVNPGTVACFGPNFFGICDINNCALPQMVSLGTTCQDGAVAKRDMVSKASAHLVAAIRPELQREKRWTNKADELSRLVGRSADKSADTTELWDTITEAMLLEYRSVKYSKKPLPSNTDTVSLAGPIPIRWSDARPTPNDSLRRRETRGYDSKRYQKGLKRARSV